MMLQRLEEEGIKAYLENEHTVTIDPLVSNAIGGIRLLVLGSQLERAIELIEGFERTYKEAAACPKCNSLNVHYIVLAVEPKGPLLSALNRIFGSIILPWKNVYHCFDCEYDFENLSS
jgi:hypothetical protein